MIGGPLSTMSEILAVIWILLVWHGLRPWLLGFVWSSHVWFSIFALPLNFHGRVRVIRFMFLRAALHGVEASLLASASLRRLRSSVYKVVWSRRQPLASVGAVLGLLDGPTGCDPAFCVVWFTFRLFRRYLALWHSQVGRAYRLLEMVGEGAPGHGPIHLLSASAAEIGFRWDSDALAWSRPGLPLLSNLAGPIQHVKDAIIDAWRNRVAADLCGWKVFVVCLCWISMGLCSFLTLLMFGIEIRVCFVMSWLGVSGMVFFLDGFEARFFHVGSVVLLIMMFTFFWNVPFLLLLRSWKS